MDVGFIAVIYFGFALLFIVIGATGYYGWTRTPESMLSIQRTRFWSRLWTDFWVAIIGKEGVRKYGIGGSVVLLIVGACFLLSSFGAFYTHFTSGSPKPTQSSWRTSRPGSGQVTPYNYRDRFKPEVPKSKKPISLGKPILQFSHGAGDNLACVFARNGASVLSISESSQPVEFDTKTGESRVLKNLSDKRADSVFSTADKKHAIFSRRSKSNGSYRYLISVVDLSTLEVNRTKDLDAKPFAATADLKAFVFSDGQGGFYIGAADGLMTFSVKRASFHPTEEIVFDGGIEGVCARDLNNPERLQRIESIDVRRAFVDVSLNGNVLAVWDRQLINICLWRDDQRISHFYAPRQHNSAATHN